MAYRDTSLILNAGSEGGDEMQVLKALTVAGRVYGCHGERLHLFIPVGPRPNHI